MGACFDAVMSARRGAVRCALIVTMACAAILGSQDVRAEDGFGLPTAEPESVGMSSERLARIRPVMEQFVKDKQVPGLITVIARKGKVVHFETIGNMDAEEGTPMRPDAIFRMYSMTKPVTGAAVMMLFEEGHFLLSDPISKFLPEFSKMRVYLGEEGGEIKTEAAKPITIKHLLTHTSGLSYDFFPFPVGRMYQKAGLGLTEATAAGMDLEAWVKKLAEMPLVNQPGTEWHYSLSLDVLGRLVEVISGQSYGDFLEKRLFGPLGMVDAGFWVTDDQIDRFTTMYAPTPAGGMVAVDKPAASAYRKETALYMGGAGLVCTAADYLRFAQMLLNGGELDGVRVLSPTTVALMTSNHLGAEYGDTPLAMLSLGSTEMFGRGVGFGLAGSVITDAVATGMPGSNGEYSWGGAASTDFWIDAEEELVGMVLTQLIPAGTYPTRVRMHQMTYQAIAE